MSNKIFKAADSYTLPSQDLRALLEMVTSPELTAASLADRRKLFLSGMATLLQADIGVWSWGRGFSVDGGIQPVAMIDHGMTMPQKTHLAEAGLDRKNDLEFRALIIRRMDETRRATVIREDIYSDAEWDRKPSFRRICDGLGMTSWITSVLYPRPDTWCNITYWRKANRGELGERERQLLDLVMSSVSWLLPTVRETVPAETFTGLTPRQRTVLLLLLDGLSRKSIAAELKLTEHTVGDHVKSIYQHFQVHSVNELAAQMLKSI